MNYDGFFWAEAIILLPIPIFLAIFIGECLREDCYDKWMASMMSGLFLFLPAIVVPATGWCLPNAADDSKCLLFLENCDQELLEVRASWPEIRVTYDKKEVFPSKVRRTCVNYVRNNNSTQQEINQTINDVLRKGLEGSEQ